MIFQCLQDQFYRLRVVVSPFQTRHSNNEYLRPGPVVCISSRELLPLIHPLSVPSLSSPSSQNHPTFLRRPVITLLHGDQRQAITFFFVIFRIRHIIGVFTPNTGAKTSCDILISRIRHGRLVVECKRVEATLGKQIPESQQWWCFRV